MNWFFKILLFFTHLHFNDLNFLLSNVRVNIPLYLNKASTLSNISSHLEPSDLISWNLSKTIQHDDNCFTQGISILNQSTLIQTCGLYGVSRLQIFDIKNLESNISALIYAKAAMPENFYEGNTVANDSLYILTWKEHHLIRLNLQDLTKEAHFWYPHDGWGLAYDNQTNTFFASNGSQYLIHFTLDTHSREVRIVHEIPVFWRGEPLLNLNELEFDGTYLYANIWYSSKVFIIHPYTGFIIGYLDLRDLSEPTNVHNGIGYMKSVIRQSDGLRDVYLWVTGKLWKKMHLIHFYLPK